MRPSKSTKKQINKKVHFGIVVSKFNEFITKRLFDACLDELQRHGVGKKQLTLGLN